ncbi:hypothetical protein [Candidatus Electronema sp. JM]|uniref:hypothetical protein n=1 Tax=Candidatus Electronema sp. JM TaxID=3401571 RepID=UPI003AA95D27
MRNKICLKIIFLAEVFLSPWQASGADVTAFDQFTAAFDAGLFQGTQISSELSLESEGSSGSTQGVNVIAYTAYSGKAAQVALLEQGVTLFLSGGNNVVQGINVYRGSAESVTQLTAASGAVRLSAPSTSGSIQGVNVITDCDSCN